MALAQLDKTLQQEILALQREGRAKPPERVITGYLPPEGERGPRYTLQGEKKAFLRMNSNSYLSLSNHPQLIAAADTATHRCGVGPGAVRFIDGTFIYHQELEQRVAQFVDKPAAKIFNSAYTANCGLALTISSKTTHWIGDQLNHNSIIRAMRIAGVPSANKGIYGHNDMDELRRCLDAVGPEIDRVVVIFDGIFSMRGDYAPIDTILSITGEYSGKFRDGVITVVDDSHGIGAYGAAGRGTVEYSGGSPDIIIGTFGKAFGVNGGFIAASTTLIEMVRQKADTYIYTNPLSVADCAAATKALDICDSQEGQALLQNLKQRTQQFRRGLEQSGIESIAGPHPVVPVMVRDTAKTRALVNHLYANGILVVGLTFPVVPRGDESMRFQINAAHTPADIDYVLEVLAKGTVTIKK
ncbi:pyridoxal phosphate-dependent aminotransferase family protein [Desulfopila sp. IMCC35006]|uniref:aminotransferase class I/II-fold pyridoxal phosphate-dependent enzyme n=1 Tax=Desulfopila sp. IMCC35006 TaxID=2569542 RepID=UPI0010AD7A52|nr:pyridoxal phosphate-dependent aminotransferase family protein [Desulfopila sp. IMCC35006]TKB23313.1 pyridoxal phosphate-dependent aminotransferase family protein [Desulfopila sp. IMCC35006]